MPSDDARRLSLLLLGLALGAFVALAVWASRTPVPPNSDRFDYLGRAHLLLEGEGPRALVSYPLRFALEDAGSVPPPNATRPPLWPALLAPALALGADPTAGVWTSLVGLVTLGVLVALAGDRAFAPGAGGFAALALAGSFAMARALWGGGPEIWLALLLFFVWSWSPDRTGPPAWPWIGLALALMPWLHPIGWLYAGLGWIARRGRETTRAWLAMALVALIGGVGWYLTVGRITGVFLSPLQALAEVAKSIDDAGGLGPYRTLEARPTLEVLGADAGRWLYHCAWNLKELVLHLDGWLAWPLVVCAAVGSVADRRLALRDAGLGLIAFATVSTVANDPRLLVPVLPIASVWAGAGAARLLQRLSPGGGGAVALLAVALPWLLPLGASARPGTEMAAYSDRELQPSTAIVTAYAAAGRPGTPIVTDAAVLAWRARRPSIFLPDSPSTLDHLRARSSATAPTAIFVLDPGRSPWIDAEWRGWLESHPGRTTVAGAWRVDLETSSVEVADGSASRVYVPEALDLGPDDVPDSLIAIPVPPAAREGLRVTAATARALARLVRRASDDGVELRVVSAYRSYERQAVLFESAVRRHGADQRWVARPGSSEHQLGETIDFADAALAHATEASFAKTDEGRWLRANAWREDFVRSYTEANADQTGIRPEPWHYRYRPRLDARRPMPEEER